MRSILVLILIGACGGDHKDSQPVGNTATSTCAATSAELKSYLASVWDKNAKPAPPWPTGDAATDQVINDARDRIHKASDPNQPASHLSAGIRRGPVDDELDKCPAAAASLKQVGTAETDDQKTAGFVGVADGIRDCDCKLNIPLVRAGLYIIVRGAD